MYSPVRCTDLSNIQNTSELRIVLTTNYSEVLTVLNNHVKTVTGKNLLVRIHNGMTKSRPAVKMFPVP